MNTMLTITSKGQTTLPAVMRRQLGVPKQGGQLKVEFDEQRKEIKITKLLSIEELSARAMSFIKPGTKPILNVDEYYQAYREARLQ